jgi:hypothetical protein
MARPTMTIENDMLDDFPQEPPALGELAKLDTNLSITQERSLFGDIVTAQPIRVARDEPRLLQKMDVLGARNGARFFYRYPVRNKRTRQVDYIEGPTVKCTDACFMAYKNVAVESRTIAIPGDKGGNYVCYSRFCDWENGVSLTMGQIVPRSATLGGDDEERRQQIAHNVGQSKSRRNVVNAALGEYVNRAYLSAKKSLIERIGRNIDKSRAVITEHVDELGVPGLMARIEHIYGRKAKDFLATDIAAIYAELQAINDGMSSIDETWPPIPPPEPRRGVSDVPGSGDEPERAVSDAPLPTPGPATPAAVPASPQQADASLREPSAPPAERDWRVGDDVIGQEAILRRLHQLLGETQSDLEVDALIAANNERIGKLGRSAPSWGNAVSLKRLSFRKHEGGNAQDQ